MTTVEEALLDLTAAVDARLTEHGARVAPAMSTAYPYVATYVSSPATPSEDLSGSRRRLVFQVNTVVVAESEAQCTALLARVVGAFHRWRPDVGAQADRVHKDAPGLPPGADDSLPDRRVWTARDAWSVSILI